MRLPHQRKAPEVQDFGGLVADEARFELAEAFTSHAFEACSLDRSDTYPCAAKKRNLFIISRFPDYANQRVAHLPPLHRASIGELSTFRGVDSAPAKHLSAFQGVGSQV